MLRFVQSWFAPAANPIGVDFGSDCLRMAQVEVQDGEHRLVAAASAEVPSHVRQDPAARISFFANTVRELLIRGNFRGRRAVLALPAASMHIQHLRMPRLDEEETKKALPWEARGKLAIDPSQALLRHLIAGEVYQEQEQKNEVILMAANREMINQLLAAASRARLDVVGMNVEPKALAECFASVYRRKTDADITNCFIDIGCTASRAVIARGSHILFARVIPVGGDHFNRAVSEAMKISFDDAKVLRIKLARQQPTADEGRDKRELSTDRRTPDIAPSAAAVDEEEGSFALLAAGMAASQKQPGAVSTAARTAVAEVAPRVVSKPDDTARQVERACEAPLQRLVAELDLCRRYHESVFPNRPVDRLIFVGGEARHRTLCQYVAREMSLAAQVGDPLVRMGRTSEVGVESGIDRRQPQPGWAVAIGLSMGPDLPPAAKGQEAVRAETK